MKPAYLLFVLAACKTSGNGDDFPISPGGGGGGGSGGGSGELVDSGLDAPSTTLSGRVCVTADFRDLTTCADTGVDGLTVTLGSKMATTDLAGFFEMPKTTGSNLVWHVTGTNIVPSVVPFTTSLVVPAVTDIQYLDLLAANGQQPLAAGQGSIVARVTRNGAALADATATLGAAQNGQTYYDGNNPTTFDQDATSTFGMVWMPVELAGAYTLTATPMLGTGVTQPVSVEDQSITYIVVDVP